MFILPFLMNSLSQITPLFRPEEALQSCGEEEEVHRGPGHQDNRRRGRAGGRRRHHDRGSRGLHQRGDGSSAQTGNGAGCGWTAQHAVLRGGCQSIAAKVVSRDVGMM